jgi:hypothetical protein
MATLTAPCTAVVESTEGMDLWAEGLVALENLGWGLNAYGSPKKTVVELTVENRGLVARLRRNQRLVWDDRIWYGVDFRQVTLRVWHDGSISVEYEVER